MNTLQIILFRLRRGLQDYYRLCGTAGILPLPTEARNLRRDEVIRLAKTSGITAIEVLRGTVWLTGTPSNGDVVLSPGERFELRDNWPFVIQALEGTELSLLTSGAPARVTPGHYGPALLRVASTPAER